MEKFIPDLGGWKIADLLRLSYDIEYREAMYRKANPDFALEDSLSENAKHLIQYGKKIANSQSKRLHEIGLNKQDYEAVANLVASKTITASSSASLLESIALNHTSDVVSRAKEIGIILNNDDEAVVTVVTEVFIESPKPVIDYINGKDSALGAIVGFVMKRKTGMNPATVKEKIIQIGTMRRSKETT